MRTFGIGAGSVWLLATGMLAGCAPIVGFPNDPAGSSALSVYYGPQSEAEYDKASSDDTRTLVRDKIVRQRLHGYDLEYSDFKRGLVSQGNVVGVGGGLAALALAGLAATTGHAATASALAAAGGGVIGAQGLINKELYFQKTLPALIAQMDAARDRVLLTIINGLKTKDSQYSLLRANMDLAKLKDAGSMDAAISMVNEQASEAKSNAAKPLRIERDANFLKTLDEQREVRQRLNILSDADIVRLANTMLPAFRDLPDQTRALASRYMPQSGMRFTAAQGQQARRFLVFWSGSETMTPERLSLWMREIDAL